MKYLFLVLCIGGILFFFGKNWGFIDGTFVSVDGNLSFSHPARLSVYESGDSFIVAEKQTSPVSVVVQRFRDVNKGFPVSFAVAESFGDVENIQDLGDFGTKEVISFTYKGESDTEEGFAFYEGRSLIVVYTKGLTSKDTNLLKVLKGIVSSFKLIEF